MTIPDIIAIAIMGLGMTFLLLGTLGILRFPDFYTRMHAAGKCDTLGALLLTLGMAVHHGFSEIGSFKLLLIAVFIFITSPTATHAISRAAWVNKLPMWTRSDQEGKEGEE